MQTPTKHKFILLSILFVMIISSSVLITQFGTGVELSATYAQSSAHNSTYVASAYNVIGNTVIIAENASLRGYIKGTKLWLATTYNAIRIGMYGVFVIGNSLKVAVRATIINTPDIYLNGIYTVGNSIAYLGIKSVSANSVASAGLVNFLGKNIPIK